MHLKLNKIIGVAYLAMTWDKKSVYVCAGYECAELLMRWNKQAITYLFINLIVEELDDEI